MGGKVSVIIPVYNSEKYIGMCIDSIITQTYKNIEIIIIDDGSTDNSLKICNEYAIKDERIKVFHQENKGVSAARNYGIEVAEGRYITFVDSDDELIENGLLLLVKDIETFEADISTASKIHVTLDNIEKKQSFENGENEVKVFSGTETLEMSLNFDRRMTACHGKLFRKQFIENIRYVEGRKINEDFYFVFLCCLNCPTLTYREEPVYKYYYRENSATHESFNVKYFDMIYFADMKRQMIETHYPELLDKALCMEVSTHLFLLNLLCRTGNKEYTEEKKRSLEFVRKNYKKYTTSNRFEKRFSWIVAHGLYPIYKAVVHFKYYR